MKFLMQLRYDSTHDWRPNCNCETKFYVVEEIIEIMDAAIRNHLLVMSHLYIAFNIFFLSNVKSNSCITMVKLKFSEIYSYNSFFFVLLKNFKRSLHLQVQLLFAINYTFGGY
jgi:hypothetical protein